MFPEEESNSVDKKWEEIKQLLYPEEKHSPCRSKCKRQSLGELLFNDFTVFKENCISPPPPTPTQSGGPAYQ